VLASQLAHAALLPGVDSYIGIDGLHPTEIGYRRMAETFYAAVVSDLEVK
jgi:lysophospholipase L1-like esterase